MEVEDVLAYDLTKTVKKLNHGKLCNDRKCDEEENEDFIFSIKTTTTTESSPLFAGMFSWIDGKPCFLISCYFSIRRCMVAHI